MKEYAGKVLMLLENHFPGDVRPRNEAYTLTRAGYKVTVIALQRKGQKSRENIDGIQVYRIPKLTLFKKSCKPNAPFFRKMLIRTQSLVGYMYEYLYFTSACLILSTYIAFKEGFDVVHAHNPPDTLFIVGAFYKLFGKKFVFDHHDLSPELYQSRMGIKGGIIYRVLIIVEKLCLKIANVTIATNESYREIEIKRGSLDPERVFVVRNGPDLKRVKRYPPDAMLKKMDKKILTYLGVINPQDGVDYLLRALNYLKYRCKRTDFFCVIIGTGDSLEDVRSLSGELGLEDNVWFTGFLSDGDMLRYLSTADICLDPNPSNSLNDVSTWIKVMEYMALGKPVVSFGLKETRVTAKNAAIYVRPNDEAEFARAILKLMDDPVLREKMGKLGRMRVENELNWDIVSKNLLLAYQDLFS